jgi:PAS domain S-box-containing protein
VLAARPLAVIMDSTFEFMGMLGSDGRLLDANRSALAFIGARLSDVVGRPFWDTPWWSGQESRTWCRNAIARAASGVIVRAEVEHVAPDGRRIVVDFSLTPLRGDGGQVAGLVAEGRDITDRKRLELERDRLLVEALGARREAETAARRARFLADVSQALTASLDFDVTFERLAALIVPSVATFCILDVLDEHGGVRRMQVVHARPEMRDAAARLGSYPRGGQRLHLTSEALHHGSPRLMAHVDDEFLRAIAVDEAHLTLLRALGPESYMVAPLVARGRTLGAIAFCRDASAPPYADADLTMAEDLAHRAALALDNARLYDESCRATRSRDDMLGVVSHDLRNPLAAISMCVAALLDGADVVPSRRRELLGTIRESTDWAHRMIEDLLDIAAIEAGRLSVDRRPVDPCHLAERVVELFEPLAAERRITLTLELPPRCPQANADADRMLQLLANLLGNALKFTPEGGRVGIHVASDGDTVRLSVTDTGPGVPPEDVPFIFERYWQARRSSKVKGTGLGLAIVKGIADAHEGRAWVERLDEGGSRFSVSLPALESAN